MMTETATLVQAIADALPDSHEWDEREAALLDLALRQRGILICSRRGIAHNGVRLERGQLNSALMEARQSRVALARILGQVEIPEWKAVHGACSQGRECALGQRRVGRDARALRAAGCS